MADDEPGNRKRRLQNACDECRRKKIRCDSATAPGNICTSCLSWNIDCTHVLEKKKRGRKVGYGSGISRHGRTSKRGDNPQALVNAILSYSEPFIIPDDREAVWEMLVSLANHARSLDKQLSSARRRLTPENDASSESSPFSPSLTNVHQREEDGEAKDSIDHLAAELKQVNLALERRHFGKSGLFLLVHSAVDARQDNMAGRNFLLTIFENCKRPEFWKPPPPQQPLRIEVTPFVYPEDDLLRDLIELYFTRHNPTFPLSHRPTFERLVWQEGLHLRDQSFGATVLAVCALASRQSSDPRTLCEGNTSEYILGWKYFRQIPLLCNVFTEPATLYDIQLCALSAFYLKSTYTPDVVGTYGMDPVEDELWKRAFWLLVSMDLFMSAFRGRPRATTSDDFDCDLPRECDDEYWENPDPKQALVQPEGKPSVLSFFVAYLKLVDIIGFVQRNLYSVGRKSELWSGMGISGIEWKRKAVTELDSALNKFLDEIPDHLKWDPEMSNPVFFQQSALLHCTYHWVQIQVHRPFIPRPGQEPILASPALAICSNAARKVVYISETLQARRDQGMLALEMGPPLTLLFASAIILLVSIRHPKRTTIAPKSETQKEMTEVYRCMQLMSKYEATHQMAGRLIDILSGVLIAVQISGAEAKSLAGDNLDESTVRESGLGLSSSRAALGGVRESFHEGNYGQEITAHTPINTLDYSTSFSAVQNTVPTSSSSSLPMGSTGIESSFPAHLPSPPTGGENSGSGYMDNSTAADEFMLHQPLFGLHTQTVTPSSFYGNVDFTQYEWNSFMSDVDDIMLNGGGDYRWC
ncbi:Gypsy retrotransposon integrase-like protein 1 [Marasmius sp. AFHP31]|nr:Gypsy retrotransposon integrase-like protein 1 [Marasmius sp. AFHP31]